MNQEQFKFQNLLHISKQGNITGPMSPMMAANKIAEEFEIKFSGLVRWWWADNYDHLIMRHRYKNGIWYALFIDMGVSLIPAGQWFWKDNADEEEVTISGVYRKQITPEKMRHHYDNCEKDYRYDKKPIAVLDEKSMKELFKALEASGEWKLEGIEYDDEGRQIKNPPATPVINEPETGYGNIVPKVEIHDDLYKVICPKCGNWEMQPIDQQRNHIKTFSILEFVRQDFSMIKCILCDHIFLLDWRIDDPVKPNTVAVWDLRIDLRDMPETSQTGLYLAIKEELEMLKLVGLDTESLASIMQQMESFNTDLSKLN